MEIPIVIVGAGASGIGIGVLLQRLHIPFVIIDQAEIGASFCNWSKETRFISPSFSGNAFGSIDLNAVTPDTSPAFTLCSEHPTGREYAEYLAIVAEHFDLPIKTGITVNNVIYHPEEDYDYSIDTNEGSIEVSHIIWAAGEFGYPNRNNFDGAEHCLHYADVESWAELEGDDFHLIGGYESGIDAAYQLAILDKRVTVYDGSDRANYHSSDSSYTLSPFTRDRFRQAGNEVTIVNNYVESVRVVNNASTNHSPCYQITTSDQSTYTVDQPPIDCSGFSGSLSLVEHLFEFKDGVIQLNEFDESTCCPNFFLVGPQVRHDSAIFCFIYKYRQRFGVVGEEIAKRLKVDEALREEVIDYYRKQQFYLTDLSCCDDECTC